MIIFSYEINQTNIKLKTILKYSNLHQKILDFISGKRKISFRTTKSSYILRFNSSSLNFS